MRILVITPYYAPDLGASAGLYEMLCQELVCLGHEVSVISAVPHYPTGRVSSDFKGRLIQREKCRGVDVTRVWVPSLNRSNLGQRLLIFLCYQLLAVFVGMRRRYEVVIASNPAFEVALPLLYLGFVWGKRVIYSVHEIYPDVGVKLGIFRNRAVIAAIDWMERLCFRRAAYVRVISEGYKKSLEARGVPESKLVVIGDWINTDFVRPQPRRNAFSAEWGLDDLFVVMYAGNIGPTQGLESVVETAQLLAAKPSIRFVFVGEGASKAGLEALAKSRGLKNILFAPFQAREVLPQVLATADVSLVTLKEGLAANSVPSKFFSILASGRPVIASVDPDSDISALVRASQCGVVAEPENPHALADKILDLSHDVTRRDWFGENGRNYVSRFRSKRQAAERFQSLIVSSPSPTKQPAVKPVQEGQVVRDG